MPRTLRSDFSGQIYHALNRGNARNRIFFKEEDFETYERVIKPGLKTRHISPTARYPVNLIAYQWMSNQGCRVDGGLLIITGQDIDEWLDIEEVNVSITITIRLGLISSG